MPVPFKLSVISYWPLPAFAESHGLCPWMNAERVSTGAFGVGGCASAGFAEVGGATGSARGAPLSGITSQRKF